MGDLFLFFWFPMLMVCTFYSEDNDEIWNRHSSEPDTIVPWSTFLFNKISLLKAGSSMY